MHQNAHAAIEDAETLLLGEPPATGARDPRWQAIAAVGRFAREDPAAVWPFVRRWGSHPDVGIRTAVASAVLEPLVGAHFAGIASEMEQAIDSDPLFADTLLRCWPLDLGSADHVRRFDAIKRVAATRAAPPDVRLDG